MNLPFRFSGMVLTLTFDAPDSAIAGEQTLLTLCRHVSRCQFSFSRERLKESCLNKVTLAQIVLTLLLYSLLKSKNKEGRLIVPRFPFFPLSSLFPLRFFLPTHMINLRFAPFRRYYKISPNFERYRKSSPNELLAFSIHQTSTPVRGFPLFSLFFLPSFPFFC